MDWLMVAVAVWMVLAVVGMALTILAIGEERSAKRLTPTEGLGRVIMNVLWLVTLIAVWGRL